LAKKPSRKKPPSSKPDSAEATKKLEGGTSPSESRIAVFEPAFREDLRFWVDCDRKVALRLMDLVESVMVDPFDGIGKPEPLKYLGANIWSRRITDEHRLVYRVQHDRIVFLQARFHYS
jgi:toxin YoeB